MEENNHHFVFLFGSNQQKAFKWPYILIPKNEKMSKFFFSFFLILKFKHCTGTKILHLCTIWRVKSFISSFFHKLTTVPPPTVVNFLSKGATINLEHEMEFQDLICIVGTIFKYKTLLFTQMRCKNCIFCQKKCFLAKLRRKKCIWVFL
jgi:hypothetical protein